MAAFEEIIRKATMIANTYVNTANPPAHLVPDTLYHYTDASGLIGMLSSRSFWATDYRFLNDRSEITHTENLVTNVISESMKNCESGPRTDLYSKILSFPESNTNKPIYIFSFSENRDSLSQWRGYARDGKGFTIGFGVKELLEYEDNFSSPFGLTKIEYDHGRQELSIKNALKEFSDLICLVNRSEDGYEEFITSVSELFRFVTVGQSCSNKHFSFHSEQEWRAVTVSDSPIKEENFQVRVRQNDLVPYIVHSTKSGKDGNRPLLPLRSIGIGPGFTSSAQRVAAEQLCLSLGYDVEIYEADSPYRSN